MISYLYQITSPTTPKVYIGKTINLKKRWAAHKNCANRGKESYIYHTMRKYGISNFTMQVLAVFGTEADCYAAEIALIAYYKGLGLSLNMHPGGAGNSPVTPNGRLRRVQSLIGNKRGLGYKHTVEHITSIQGAGNPNYKFEPSLIATFPSMVEAKRATGISKTQYYRLRRQRPDLDWAKN
jgi:group I intron endonuclease